MATASDLQQLYIGYFGRAADQEGLNFWLDAINNGGLSLANVHASFVQSAEYNAQYEGMTVAQKVAAVYENVLGRVADEGGLEFWTNAITTGVITEDQLIEGLLSGLSANDAAIISNKIVVANYYTSAKGDAYVEASKAESAAILGTVDATVGSVSTALTSVASVTGVSNAQLASALATLDAAQDAQQAYAEAYLGAGATVSAANTAITTALGTATGALNTAIGNVGGTAVNPAVDSAANITTKIQSAVTLAANNVSAAQAAVSAVTGLTAKVNTFNTQLAAFENAVKVANAAATEQAAELAKFNVVNGVPGTPTTLTVAANGTVTGVIALDGTNLVIDSAYAAAATPVKLAAANELLADIKASLAAEKAQVDAAAALDATGAAIAALGTDLYTPVSGDTPGSFATGPATAPAKGLVEALAEQKALLDAIPKFSEAATTFAEFKALADAIIAASTAITSATGLNYSLEDLDGGDTGTTGNDVFMVGDNDVTLTTAGGLLNAGDVLFVGPGYKLGTDLDSVKAGPQGDPAVLEVFITQATPTANVVVTVEQTAFGTNLASGDEATTITLTGITDLSKVAFDAQTGLITIA